MNRQGVVTAVGPPLLVRLDGDLADITAGWATTYTPALGDRVILSRWGSQWVVLSEVIF